MVAGGVRQQGGVGVGQVVAQMVRLRRLAGGDDEPARTRVRSMLSSLKKQKREAGEEPRWGKVEADMTPGLLRGLKLAVGYAHHQLFVNVHPEGRCFVRSHDRARRSRWGVRRVAASSCGPTASRLS